ncbi:MAG: MFS transporter [Myxococcota bacterium]|nr:MFS transporter [Myxococcota bacterium]
MITEWLSWRWTFLINVPVGLAVLAASMLWLRRGQRQGGGVDLLGTLAITGSMIVAVYAMVTGEHLGWASTQTLALLATATALLGAFVVIQRVRKEPLVPLRIFSAPNLTAGKLVTALLAAAWIPLWFLNLYLQQVLGYSALDGGLALLPMTTTIMMLMVGVTARIINRFGFKPNLVAGLVLLAVSLAMFAMAPTGGSFLLHVLPASLVAAVGMSLAYIPATIAAIAVIAAVAIRRPQASAVAPQREALRRATWEQALTGGHRLSDGRPGVGASPAAPPRGVRQHERI